MASFEVPVELGEYFGLYKESPMRILTYKRTHTGDPDNRGVFGINDCMGAVRNRVFDAVVGIGSKAPWRDAKEIAGKVTWVGVGPFRMKSPTHRGDLIAFEKFVLLDGNGPDFERMAPNLAKRFYEGKARSILNSYSKIEKEELERLIFEVLKSDKCISSEAVSAEDKLAKRRGKCVKKYTCPGKC
ncbi:hypothetical protein [Pseudomonas indica]|uniref:hypothetical protein n=1 Tax=Pseudomonas indica TaxID=137658 RepID=UPI0011144173|nr:hypothetical protein [Pseudomonas indica]